MTTGEVTKAASKITLKNLLWIIMGDKTPRKEAIKAKNFGQIQYIDADGNAI